MLKVANVKRIILRKMYVKDYSEYVYEYATEYNVDPLLVFAVIKAESNFKKDATSTSNAIGLMQLMENTAIETGEKVDEKSSKISSRGSFVPGYGFVFGSLRSQVH